MFYKFQIFPLFILLNSYIFSQPTEPTSDYKYVLRIQREIEAQVGYYLDEPRTGDFKKVHSESMKYLLLAEEKPNDKSLQRRSEKVRQAVGQMIRKNYNPNIVKSEKKNIRYHYFFIDEFSKD
ncbi:MAG: hypothetical protein CMG58_01705 [Candidatus Marinimicrobia bacterium]|nr:hypothetical protein [Candidatus Neomarinimicrobiota bacterium]|tara:strand:- start:1131 stop:1499 length:369 start_codon:yes stop_codon:yes gene_type:complete